MQINKTLLILGSNSFAGGCLVEQALKQDYNVVGINRSAEQAPCMTPYKIAKLRANYQFHQLDLNHDFTKITQLIDYIAPQFIVDLAGQGMVAESWQAPEQWYQTNVLAKVKLISFLQDKSYLQRYLRVSTPEVYGSTDNLLVESNIYKPSTPYAISHATIDMHLTAYCQQFDFPAILTRFSNFYGPSQQLYRIVPRTIIYAKSGKKLSLHGGGLSTRAFIYGDDAAEGILAALVRGKVGQTYHFSTDEFVTIKRLVSQIYQYLGVEFSDMVTISDDRLAKELKYLMDDNKAKNDLAWQPKVNLSQGLQQTITWLEEYWPSIQDQPFNYIHKA